MINEKDIDEVIKLIDFRFGKKDSSKEIKVLKGELMNLNDNTMLSTFRDCPRKYFYRFILHLTSSEREMGIGALFGIAIHTALEVFYSSNEGKREKAEDAFLQAWVPFEGEDLTGKCTSERGIVIINEYEKHYKEDPFKVIDTEVTLHGVLSEGSHFVFNIDAIVEWEGKEGFYVMEHKTSARKGFLSLRPNLQTEGYVWAVKQLMELDVKGVIFNIINYRKGRKGEEVRDTIEFSRVMTQVVEGELREWKRDVRGWLKGIKACEEEDYWMKATECCRRYGACSFLSLCEVSSLEARERLKKELFVEKRWNPLRRGE